ncbi:hypothetical protein VTK56DRAFT_9855 [Thermocarpiscus australiensis]
MRGSYIKNTITQNILTLCDKFEGGAWNYLSTVSSQVDRPTKVAQDPRITLLGTRGGAPRRPRPPDFLQSNRLARQRSLAPASGGRWYTMLTSQVQHADLCKQWGLNLKQSPLITCSLYSYSTRIIRTYALTQVAAEADRQIRK